MAKYFIQSDFVVIPIQGLYRTGCHRLVTTVGYDSPLLNQVVSQSITVFQTVHVGICFQNNPVLSRQGQFPLCRDFEENFQDSEEACSTKPAAKANTASATASWDVNFRTPV